MSALVGGLSCIIISVIGTLINTMILVVVATDARVNKIIFTSIKFLFYVNSTLDSFSINKYHHNLPH